jgi:hypothetical protein
VVLVALVVLQALALRLSLAMLAHQATKVVVVLL